jgi:hypothetical protein
MALVSDRAALRTMVAALSIVRDPAVQMAMRRQGWPLPPAEPYTWPLA